MDWRTMTVHTFPRNIFFHLATSQARDCLANHPHVTYLQSFLLWCAIVGVFALFFAAHNGIFAEILVDARIGNLEDGVLVITGQESVLEAGLSDSLCTFWYAFFAPFPSFEHSIRVCSIACAVECINCCLYRAVCYPLSLPVSHTLVTHTHTCSLTSSLLSGIIVFFLTPWLSLSDSRNARAYLLTFGLLIGAGLLPYIKCYMMAFCFVAPRKILPVNARKALLRTLDHLNKLTLSVNVGMALLSVVCDTKINDLANLLFEELGLGEPIVNPDYLDAAIFVEVDTGFFLSLAGCVLSWLVGVLMLFIHRMNEEPVPIQETVSIVLPQSFLDMNAVGASFDRINDEVAFADGRSYSVVSPSSSFMNREDHEKWGRSMQVTTIATLFFTFVAVLRSSFENIFAKNIGGIASLVLRPEEQQEDYTLVGFYQTFVDSSPDSSTFGTQLTRIVLILANFVVPLLHIIMLLALYVVRLKTFEQWQLYYATELVGSASCLHVFLGVVIALWVELDPLVREIAESVSLPDSAEEVIAGFGGLLTISVTLSAWYFSLFIAGLLIQLMNMVVLTGAEERVMERIRRQHQQLQRHSINSESGMSKKAVEWEEGGDVGLGLDASFSSDIHRPDIGSFSRLPGSYF
jgi:hypothetical protein